MADLHELARMLKDLDDQMVTCMRCGMCQAVCPVYAETGREADVARGKIAMLGALSDEIISRPEEVKARLDKCLLCGSCAANCPSGVQALDIFLKARAVLTGYLGLSPAKKVIFKGMLSNPGLFNKVLAMGAKFQGLFVKEADWLIGSSCARFQAPVIGDRHFKALAETPLHKRVSPLDTPRPADGPAAGKKAGIFVGCVIDKVFPSIGEATLKALRHHGAGVFLPEGQACCGIPALASGDLDTFKKLVRMNLAVYEKGDFDRLITACATCASTMKKVWPLMAGVKGVFEPAEIEKIKALAEKVTDVSQYLVDELGVKAVEKPGANTLVTYHDPCHLKKSLKVSAQPRELIKANPSCALVEMNEADWCCGCGGSFNLQEYETSRRIGQRKRDNIVASKAWVAATSCPACMLQITDMLSQAGDRIEVKHAVELYAASLP